MNWDRMREQRLKLGYTLKDLSEKTGYSVSYISQLERGLNDPPVSTLRKLAKHLECSEVWLLMGDSDDNRLKESMKNNHGSNAEYVMYQENRIPFTIPENDALYQIFTPSSLPGGEPVSLTGMFVTLQPQKWVTEKLITHQSHAEIVLVLKGQLKVIIADREYKVQAGDAFYIPKNTLHNYMNLMDKQDAECIVIFNELVY